MRKSKQIDDGSVVQFHYALLNEQDEIIDGSHEGDPLSYLQGAGNIVKGLEQALLGCMVGDRKRVTVPPELGYGLRDEHKVIDAERTGFAALEPLRIGMFCQVEDAEQGLVLATIIGLDDEAVTLDTNHPYAGQVLHFDVEVVSVRDATEQELEQKRPEQLAN